MFGFSPFVGKLRRNLSNNLLFHSLFRTCQPNSLSAFVSHYSSLSLSLSLRYSIPNTKLHLRQISSDESIQLGTDGGVVRFSFGNEAQKGGGTDGDAVRFRKETEIGGRADRDGVRFRRETVIGGRGDRVVVRFRRETGIGGEADRDVVRFRTETVIGGRADRGVARFRKGKVNKPKRGKMSRKAKLNELKVYRLKAKSKMRSPNPAVRIKYKLGKAKRKEEWLIQKLRKYEIPRGAVETHDPEILTKEERFYLKRLGWKKKHYVPVGRRGVFGNVVLNMHQHWKRHQTVIVSCRPCKPGQIHDYAAELARLSHGIIMDIKSDNTILFYRGKNYVLPELPEVLSPPNTLSKAEAIEKYKFEQSLDHTSEFIERLEKELEEYNNHLERYKLNKENEIPKPMSDVDD